MPPRRALPLIALLGTAALAACSNHASPQPTPPTIASPSTLPTNLSPTPTLARLAAAIHGNDRLLGIDNLAKAQLFNQDRADLGPDFENAVLIFVATSPDRHYWIAVYLTEPEYRGTNAPDYKLALALLEQAIALNNADQSAPPTVALHVLAALAAQHLGLTHLATSHKHHAAIALLTNSGDFPALNNDERTLYEAIPAPPTPPSAAVPRRPI
jgi:hypothetical protein